MAKKDKNDGVALDPNFDKEKAKLDKFDPRGTQTLFRTLSRNHYNLLKMVDNKASIVLTMNSIIISLLMGIVYVAPEDHKEAFGVLSKILLNFSMGSMVFALLSMLPHKYLGRKYKNSDYKGSLYAGNFADETLEEFHDEIERIMDNGNTLYREMTTDIYFLGKAIAAKQRMVVFSVFVFLSGLVVAFAYSASHGILHSH